MLRQHVYRFDALRIRAAEVRAALTRAQLNQDRRDNESDGVLIDEEGHQFDLEQQYCKQYWVRSGQVLQ